MHNAIKQKGKDTALPILDDLSPEQVSAINSRFAEEDRANRANILNHPWSDLRPIAVLTRTELAKRKKGKK